MKNLTLDGKHYFFRKKHNTPNRVKPLDIYNCNHKLSVCDMNLSSQDIDFLIRDINKYEITEIEVSSCTFDKKCFNSLADAIVASNISVCKLNCNHLHVEHIKYFSQFLSKSKIRTLDLSLNNIGSPSVEYLVLGLNKSKIDSLNISYNKVDSFSKLLGISIKNLDISGNKLNLSDLELILKSDIQSLILDVIDLSSEQIGLLSKELPNSKITNLSLSGCGLKYSDAIALLNTMSKTKINHLNLSYNSFDLTSINLIRRTSNVAKNFDTKLAKEFASSLFSCIESTKRKVEVNLTNSISSDFPKFLNYLKSEANKKGLNLILDESDKQRNNNQLCLQYLPYKEVRNEQGC